MHCTGYYGECRRRQHRTQTQPDGDSIVTKQDLTVAEPKTGETAEIEVPTLTDENKYVAQVGEIKYTSVKAAIEAAVNGQTVELLRSVTVDEPIMVKHSITIDGNGNSITRSTDGIILNVVYADGTNVTVQDLTLAGNNGGGLLQWTMEGSYKENDSPSTTPKLTVKNCTFSSDDGQKTGAGIGLWGHTSGDWFNAAKSEVVIDGCTFDTLSVGIYYNEEAPLLNLKSTVTNNIFKNLSWTGLAGIPANAEIAYNRFEQTCNGAIQYLFNAAQTQTNTYIHDNVIDSKTGIQFMPYHLNEGNQNGGKPTVFVTADMLPRIEKNVRNVDTDLVVLVAYRSATDETFKLAEGVSIDLTKNYTQGVAPTIDVEVQAGAGAPSVDEASAGTRITVTVKPDAGYELDELTVTDAKNKDLKVTKRSETTYTFHMADSKVTVEASFKLIETEPENPFTDISKSDYFYDAVLWAVDKGITSGTSANTFSPDASCTRAQMVTFLWRANGSPKADGANPFTDVSADAYYYDAVLWAVEQGITSGTSATTFSPDATVNRGQTVTFLWRANASPVVNYAMDFTDVAADAYYAEAVRWAVSEGVTAGTGDKAFSPDADCTRAQIVTFMYQDAR